MMRGQSVLVVEDEPLLRMDAALMFEEAGLSVVELDSADEALADVCEQANDVAAIFTDVQFAGEADGFDLAAAVATQWPHITVLVTSGRVRPPFALPDGVRFVPKPWRPSTC